MREDTNLVPPFKAHVYDKPEWLYFKAHSLTGQYGIVREMGSFDRVRLSCRAGLWRRWGGIKYETSTYESIRIRGTKFVGDVKLSIGLGTSNSFGIGIGVY